MIEASEEIERLYETERGPLWRALVAYSGDTDASMDAVGEAFAQAIGRWGDLRDPKAWVWSVAFRLVKREAHRRSRLLYDPALSLLDRSVEDDGSREELVHLFQMLGRMPRRQRAALILHYYVDLPDSEVASILGIKAATVRVHLARGRKRLRREIGVSDG